MKKFFITIILFLLGLYVFACIPDLILTNKIKKSPYLDFQVWNKMFSGQMDYDLLILGSSRAFVQYNPKIIDSILKCNCYNLGRDGKKQDISILCYNTYTQYNPKPKTVLCDVYFMSICKSDPYAREQFYPYLLNDQVWNTVKETHQFRPIDRFLPMSKYYKHLNNIIRFTDVTDTTYKGYFGYDKKWNGTTDGVSIKDIVTIPYQHDTNVLIMTDRWLQQCKNDGVNVIFIHSPMYIEATNKIDDTAAMWNMFRNLSIKYDIPILDYSHDSICYDTNYFYNAQHLNRRGAERFSRQLANDLKSIGIVSDLQK